MGDSCFHILFFIEFFNTFFEGGADLLAILLNCPQMFRTTRRLTQGQEGFMSNLAAVIFLLTILRDSIYFLCFLFSGLEIDASSGIFFAEQVQLFARFQILIDEFVIHIAQRFCELLLKGILCKYLCRIFLIQTEVNKNIVHCLTELFNNLLLKLSLLFFTRRELHILGNKFRIIQESCKHLVVQSGREVFHFHILLYVFDDFFKTRNLFCHCGHFLSSYFNNIPFLICI